MPRTLIIGGAGFLGSHLSDRFVHEGHDVICMDNLCNRLNGKHRALACAAELFSSFTIM